MIHAADGSFLIIVTSGVLCPFLGSPVQDRHGHTGADPARSIHVYEHLMGWLPLVCTESGQEATGMKYGKFHLYIRKSFFVMVRVVRQQNRFPREVVESPPLEIFKTQVAASLNNPL